MSECGQDVNVHLEDVIANPLPNLPSVPPTTGLGEVIGIGDWPTTGIIEVDPGGRVPTLNTYTPRLGDLAYLIKQGSQWIAIGAMSPRRLNLGGSDGGGFWSWEEFDAGSGAGDWTVTADVGTVVQTLIVNDEVSIIVGAPAVHGDKFVRVRWLATDDGFPGNFDFRALMTSPPVAVAPGQVWRLNGYARQISDAGALQDTRGTTVSAELVAPTGQRGGTATTNTGLTGDWQYFEGIRYNIPAGVTSVQVEIELGADGNGNTGATFDGAFFIDNVSLY